MTTRVNTSTHARFVHLTASRATAARISAGRLSATAAGYYYAPQPAPQGYYYYYR